MNNLTHKQAHRLIQLSSKTAEEDQALQDHLKQCAECRSYYQMDRLLDEHWHIEPARQKPTREQQQAIIDQSHPKPNLLPRWGFFDLAGAAAMIVIVLVAWFSMRDLQLSTAVEPLLQQMEQISAQAKGQLVTVNVPAPSLAGSPLFSPDEQTLTIYLPPSYNISEKHYPVVYFLPQEKSDVRYLETFLNTGIQEGTLAEMIVVVPSDPTGFDDHVSITFFVNSPATGSLADFIVKDVISFVDANYRTLPAAPSRAIAGHFVGGFSALTIALQDQEAYDVLYTMQPTLFTSESDLASSFFTIPGVRSSVINLLKQWASLPPQEAHAQVQENNWSAAVRFTVAYGLAFAATPEGSPPYFTYLYEDDAQTPAQQAVWDQWLNGTGNIEEKVSAGKENLQRLKAIGIADYDSQNSRYTTAAKHLSDVMTDTEIPHTWHEGDDVNQAFQAFLRFMNEHLVFE